MASLSRGAGVRWVVNLDVAPPAELAPVVDRWAPLVARGLALAAVGPGDLRVPDTSTMSVRSTSSGSVTRRTRKSGTYSWVRPSCT